MRFKLKRKKRFTIEGIERSINNLRRQLIALKAMLRGMKTQPPESTLVMLIKQAIEEIIDDKNIAMRVEEGSNETQTRLKIIDADTNDSLIVTITDLGWMI